jgi:hypothetical protein
MNDPDEDTEDAEELLPELRITDQEWEAAQAAAREEHAMLKAEYLREREKDGEQ